jgi:hypothetical protein
MVILVNRKIVVVFFMNVITRLGHKKKRLEAPLKPNRIILYSLRTILYLLDRLGA